EAVAAVDLAFTVHAACSRIERYALHAVAVRRCAANAGSIGGCSSYAGRRGVCRQVFSKYACDRPRVVALDFSVDAVLRAAVAEHAVTEAARDGRSGTPGYTVAGIRTAE